MDVHVVPGLLISMLAARPVLRMHCAAVPASKWMGRSRAPGGKSGRKTQAKTSAPRGGWEGGSGKGCLAGECEWGGGGGGGGEMGVPLLAIVGWRVRRNKERMGKMV